MNTLGKAMALALILWSFLRTPGITVSAQTTQTLRNPVLAEQVKLTVKCSDKEKDCRLILDDEERTKIYVARSTTFYASAEKPFKNLYIKFEKESEWLINLPDGTVLRPGNENFVHKYIALDQEIDSFRITLPPHSGMADIYAFTEGQPPDWVQIWQPPCERADLMIMPAHADDEFLWFGGAIPYYAGELGYNVQMVYLTNHNNATIRNHERLNALWLVGVRNYPVISSFLDVKESRKSAKAAAEKFGGYDKVLAFQVEQIRRFRPKVILAHDINGEYGHGAHKLDAITVLEAVTISDDASMYTKSAKRYGTYRVPKCYLHLWKENRIVVSWSDKILSRFGGKSALDMAREGFDCNKSQVISVKVKESGSYDCRNFGLAYTSVGSDTPGVNDFFEHIDMSDKAVPRAAFLHSSTETPGRADFDSESAGESGADSSSPDKETHSGKNPALIGVFTAAVIISLIGIAVIFVMIRSRRKRTHQNDE